MSFRGPRMETQTPEQNPIPEPQDDTARRRGWYVRMRRRNSGRSSTNLTGPGAVARATLNQPAAGGGGTGDGGAYAPPRNIFMSPGDLRL